LPAIAAARGDVELNIGCGFSKRRVVLNEAIGKASSMRIHVFADTHACAQNVAPVLMRLADRAFLLASRHADDERNSEPNAASVWPQALSRFHSPPSEEGTLRDEQRKVQQGAYKQRPRTAYTAPSLTA
jgi:hypothetical protein